MKRLFCTIALLIWMTATLNAQDISGDWQGAIGTGKGRLQKTGDLQHKPCVQ